MRLVHTERAVRAWVCPRCALPQNTIVVVGMETAEAVDQLDHDWLVYHEDPARIQHRLAVGCFPRIPRAQVNMNAVTAEFWNDLEERHVTVAHQDVHVCLGNNAHKPWPKLFQGVAEALVIVDNVVMQVHQTNAHSLPEEAHVLLHVYFSGQNTRVGVCQTRRFPLATRKCVSAREEWFPKEEVDRRAVPLTHRQAQRYAFFSPCT